MILRSESILGCGIDVGTNTVRMLIAEVIDGKIVKKIYSCREITRLGAGLAQTGKLSPEGALKTLELFKSFRKIIDRYNVEHIFAAATCAVREADNAAEFISEANIAGIPLITISGDEEAYYIYKGVISGIDEPMKDILIYDIGGGSTEIIYANQRKISFVESIPIGVVKLADMFDFNKAVSPKILNDCAEYVNHLLKPVFNELRNVLKDGECPDLVGTAGTVTTVAAVDMEMDIYNPRIINNHSLTYKRLALISEKLSRISAQERLAFKGLERGREDILIPGIVIIREILHITGYTCSFVSDNGLREGLTIASVA